MNIYIYKYIDIYLKYDFQCSPISSAVFSKIDPISHCLPGKFMHGETLSRDLDMQPLEMNQLGHPVIKQINYLIIYILQVCS